MGYGKKYITIIGELFELDMVLRDGYYYIVGKYEDRYFHSPPILGKEYATKMMDDRLRFWRRKQMNDLISRGIYEYENY